METIEQDSLLKTPLYNEHVSLGAKIAAFGGWLMPIQYEGILLEHAHTRNKVSVFDICHMGEFMLEADAQESGLDALLTQNIIDMPVGSCRYGFMLNDKGGVIDDLVVYRLEGRSWMLVVNAATTPVDEAHLKKHLRPGVLLRNVSSITAKLDLQGPGSLEVIRGLVGEGAGKLRYYTFGRFHLLGEDVIISRTGYTGELGFEIYSPASSVVRLWRKLLEDKRVKPAGLGCRDTLRLEMGYPLYGHDLDQDHNPLEAGLDKFVDFSKEFLGKSALLKAHSQGAAFHALFFAADSRRSPRSGFGIYSFDKRIGTVTSGSFSPSLSVGIGMGYVDRALAPGEKITVKDGATVIPATVVNKPFYTKKGVQS
jgi:aminomethyltransferase